MMSQRGKRLLRGTRRRRARRGEGTRLLRGELLETRIALAAESQLNSPLLGDGRAFSTDHPDATVRATIASVTTTAPASEFCFLDEVTLGATTSADLPVGALIESGAQVGLPAFRNDPRFAGIDGSGYSVVILDTGIDLDHPFFGPDSNGDQVADRIVYNADFITDRPDAGDRHGHGTHVSSIALSQDATYGGIAPGAGIIHLRVIDDNGFGTAQAIERALQWVVENAAAYNVASVNMSLTFGDNSSSPATRPDLGLNDELAALAALGVITVSASGNSFFEHESVPGVSYPASDPNSLSVGAVWDSALSSPVAWASGAEDHTAGPDRVVSFSQRHPSLSTVFAPGARIAAAALDGGVIVRSGTSMAAPFIAGMAAVMQELAVQTTGVRLSVAEFAELLKLTGMPVFDGDDEDDNVVNTQLEYRRADMLALGSALLSSGLGDLSVAGPIMTRSSSIPAGGRVRLDFTIANQGPADTGAFTSKFYLSSDGVIDESDILLATVPNELLGGQSHRFLRHAVDLPSSVAVGSYFLGVRLDSESLVAEANELNNVATVPVTVVDAAPDAWLLDLTSGKELPSSGASVDFGLIRSGGVDLSKSFRIHNDGSTELVLGELNVPAGYEVSGFPASVAPRETIEFQIDLVADAPDAAYFGNVSFTTNDADVTGFSFSVSGTVDHGASAESAAEIASNSSVAAAIGVAGDADWYRFDAVQGVEYHVETALGTLTDSIVRVLGAEGQPLATNDNSPTGLNSQLVWTAPYDGAFFIEVTGKAQSIGNYEISLAAGDNHGDDAANATLTTDPSWNSGAIETGDDVDWFAFNALDEVDYRFEAVLGTLPAAELRLFGPDGTTLLAPAEAGPAPALIEWRAPADGMYYLAVSGVTSQMIGSYQLVVTGDDDHGDNAANATLTQSPGSIDGDLEVENDADWFALDAVGGARFEFGTDVHGRTDTLLRLIGRDGVTELAQDDDGGQGSGSLLQWTAPAAGRYFIEISGVGQRFGDYSLQVSILDDHGDDATGATATTDPSNNLGVIESSSDADWFVFEATADVVYRAEQTAGVLSDAKLQVYDASGLPVAALPSGNGAVEWTAALSGPMYVSVEAAAGAQLGDYVVRLTGADDHGDNAPNATPLFIPGSIEGALQGLNDHDWFSFASVAGVSYRFEATVDTASSILLYEPGGATLITEATGFAGVPAVIEWTATSGDVFYLKIEQGLLTPAASTLPTMVTYSLRSLVVGRVPGDYEGDSNVDGHDFLLWQQSVNSSADLRADGNNDATVDGLDLSFWGERYGISFGGPAGAHRVTVAGADARAFAEGVEEEDRKETMATQALPWIDRPGSDELALTPLQRGWNRFGIDGKGGVVAARDRALAAWPSHDGARPLANALPWFTVSEDEAPVDPVQDDKTDWRDEALDECFSLGDSAVDGLSA